MIDIERWPEWTASVTSVKKLDSGQLVIGSRARIKQPKLLPAVWTITAVAAGRSFAWISHMPGLHIIGTHIVDSTGEGSRVTLSIEFQGMFKTIAARVFRKLNQEYLNMEAMGLKRHCEAAAEQAR